MSAPDYFSFLICDHGNGQTVNLYLNGMPLGTITAGQFHVHQFKMPDGSLRPIRFRDFPQPNRIQNIDQLQHAVFNAIGALGEIES